MDRPKRAATKVSDFRRYHLSGDLDIALQGRVDTRITQFEMTSMAEELQKELDNAKESNKKLMEDAEVMRIRNELEAEKLKEQQWHIAMERLKETREHATREHEKFLEQIKDKAEASKNNASAKILDWFSAQVGDLATPGPSDEEESQTREGETNTGTTGAVSQEAG